MKLLLLKILFINQPKDKGYVIPVVFALGLIMTLVGTISIFQSSDEQVISISQRQSSEALAAAETGIARYREQINKYKMISMYDACDSSDWAANGNCNNSGSVIESWKIAGLNIPNLNSYCPPAGAAATNNANIVQALATRTWQNIGTDASQGQYRLIDYVYNPGLLARGNDYDDPGSQQPTGILTVEGRVNQNNTNLANEPSASVSSIQVILPIQPGLPNPNNYDGEAFAAPGITSLADNLNNFNPALWITGTPDLSSLPPETKVASIDLGNMQVNGNIVVTDSDCNPDGATLPKSADFVDTTTSSVILDPRIPEIVTDPGSASNSVTPNPRLAPTPYESEVKPVKLVDIGTLPLSGDTPTNVNGDDIYYYKLVDASGNIASSENLILNPGDKIDIRDNRKVVLFVLGDIDIVTGSGGDIEINSPGSNNSSHLEIYMTDPTSKIDFRGDGNASIEALIHAPDSPVNVENSPTVSFTGALWVEDFNDNSSGSFSINPDDQYLNYSYVSDFLVNSNRKVADPIIAPPLEWNTQETQ